MAKSKTPSGKAQQQPSAFSRLPAWKKDLVCIAGLYILLVFLFKGIVFTNMIFSTGGDVAAHDAWQKATEHIEQTEHVEPLWIPNIFGGMPIFGAQMFPREVNYIQRYVVFPLSRVLFFGIDVSWMLMPYLVMGIAMFLLARQLKFSQYAALLAAITLAMNPHAIDLPETGHGSKLITLSYIPILLLLTHTLFQKRNILSLGLLSAAVSTMLLALHPQMAFYGLMVIGCYFVYELVLDAKSQPGVILPKSALFVGALVLGFAVYAYQYLPTQEYAQYSMRGGGGEPGAVAGLPYDYATNWSFHPFEMMNYLIPSFFGLQFFGDKIDYYWGWMPFTNSAIYLGVVPLFLGIVALIYRRNRLTWFLAILTAVFLLISFGRYFGVLFNLMFYYLPYFNKFRIPSMILHLVPITFGLLAAFGFDYFEQVFKSAKEPDIAKLRKRLTRVLMVIGGLLVVGLILNDAVYSFLSGFMFQKDTDMQMLRQQYGAQAVQVLSQLKRARFDRLWEGYIAFAIIAGATLGCIVTYLRGKLRWDTLALLLIVITIIDLALIDGKYINPKPNTTAAEHFQVDAALQNLKSESDTALFRVFPMGSLDEENTMMYHLLQSVEGYSPAKLKIYQEIRDSSLEKGNRNVWNMLNVKYLVAQQPAQDGSMQTQTQLNPGYLPRAWFVDSTVIATSMAGRFSILNSPSWNPRSTAIIEKELPVKISHADGAAAVIGRYSSRDIVVNTNAPNTSLLVLSEIYYPAGWKATIDGVETEIFKTNHILRSVVAPAGKHEIEFKFDPPIYYLGYTITQASWGVTALLILIGVFQQPGVRKKLGFGKDRPVEAQPQPPAVA